MRVVNGVHEQIILKTHQTRSVVFSVCEESFYAYTVSGGEDQAHGETSGATVIVADFDVCKQE